MPGPDSGFELRHSIRSVKQNFIGDSHITVIGDRPEWYTGHFINVPRVKPRLRHRHDRDAFLDTQNKIWTAVHHPEIDESFIWMMDDQFFLRPTTIEDLQTPRYDPWLQLTRRKQWHILISATFAALRVKGKPNLQYATHLPHHFFKSKLLELFQIYEYPKNLYLFELLYGCHFRTDPIPYGGTPWNGVQYPQFLRRLLKRPGRGQRITDLVGDSAILNYQSTVFSKEMKSWLAASFPHPSDVE